jgi:holo-[acyl-carrier protein] synthase
LPSVQGPQPANHLTVQVGVDIVGVERVARLVTAHPGAVEALFTPAEQAYCLRKRRKHEHLAGRFAGKEAVLKAIGTGMRRRMRWIEVEIVSGEAGRPRVQLHGEVAEQARRRGLRDLDVSISHSDGLALAHAVAVCDHDPNTGGADAVSPD